MNKTTWDIQRLLAQEGLLTRRDMRLKREFHQEEATELHLTDRLVLSLGRRGKHLVRTATVAGSEKDHGADLGVWLRGDGLLVGLRLQAKRLKPSEKGRSPGKYDQLFHGAGDADGRPQVQALIESTPPHLNAAYLFYNGLDTRPGIDSGCCTVNGYAKRHGRLGLTVTPASTVMRLLQATPRSRTLKTVLPRSVPFWCCAVCPATFAYPSPSLPQAAVAALGMAGFDTLAVVADPFDRAGLADRALDWPTPGPEVTLLEADRLPDYVRTLLSDGVLGQDSEPSARRLVVIGEPPS